MSCQKGQTGRLVAANEKEGLREKYHAVHWISGGLTLSALVDAAPLLPPSTVAVGDFVKAKYPYKSSTGSPHKSFGYPGH